MLSAISTTCRGFGLGIALEAALKFKETCGLHAEALLRGFNPDVPPHLNKVTETV